MYQPPPPPAPRPGSAPGRDIRLESYAVQIVWLFTRTSILGFESSYIVGKRPD